MAMDTSQTGQIIIKDIAERNDFKGEGKRTKKYKAAGKHPTFFFFFLTLCWGIEWYVYLTPIRASFLTRGYAIA